MQWFRWLIGGSIGGAMGAAIWIAVVYATHYEGGWIAWGVGLFVGIGVRVGAGNKGQGLGPGLAAAVIAMGAVVLAKWAVVSLLIHQPPPDLVQAFENDPSALIAARADGLVKEKQDARIFVPMRTGSASGDASLEHDYPTDIWAKAKKQWDELPLEDRQDEILRFVAGLEAAAAEGRDEVDAAAWKARFRAQFSFYDAIWFGLAIFTALRIGAGFAGSDK